MGVIVDRFYALGITDELIVWRIMSKKKIQLQYFITCVVLRSLLNLFLRLIALCDRSFTDIGLKENVCLWGEQVIGYVNLVLKVCFLQCNLCFQ